MSERAPYSRVYWSINRDPKFVGIYSDDSALALWLRLLMNADALWPASAPLPRTARPRPLQKLVDALLVDLEADDFYRIHGLDDERGRRAAAARRDPVGTQLGPKPVAGGNTDKPRQDETSTRHTEPRDPADIYWQLTGRFPVDKALTWIDSLTEQYGSEPTIAAMASAFVKDRSVQTLLGRTRDALAADARKLDKLERVDEQRRLAEKRAQPRVEEPWKVEFRESIARQYEALEKTA